MAFRKEIAAKRADLKKRHAEHKALKKALAEAQRTLAERPDDPAANEAVGRHLCFDRNDWRVGLGHLAKSTGKLRDAALADMKGTDDAQQQVNIGDLWWELSDADTSVGREGYRRRAAFWYTQALPRVTGLLKTRTEKRLEEIGDVDLAGQSSGDDRRVTIILAPGVPLVLVKTPASEDGKIKGFWLGQTIEKRARIQVKLQNTNVKMQNGHDGCFTRLAIGFDFCLFQFDLCAHRRAPVFGCGQWPR